MLNFNELLNYIQNRNISIENELVNYKKCITNKLDDLQSNKQKVKLLEHELHTLIWNFNLKEFCFNYVNVTCQRKCWLLQQKCNWLENEIKKVVKNVNNYHHQQLVKHYKYQILTILSQMKSREQISFLKDLLLQFKEFKTSPEEQIVFLKKLLCKFNKNRVVFERQSDFLRKLLQEICKSKKELKEQIDFLKSLLQKINEIKIHPEKQVNLIDKSPQDLFRNFDKSKKNSSKIFKETEKLLTLLWQIFLKNIKK